MSNAPHVYQRLVEAGMPEHVAQGVVARLKVESGSGVDPAAVNPKSDAYGIMQWADTRRWQLDNYAKAKGTKPSDLDTQIDFLLAERAGEIGNGYEGKRWQSVNDAKTAEQAYKAFVKDVERVQSEPDANFTEGLQYARGDDYKGVSATPRAKPGPNIFRRYADAKDAQSRDLSDLTRSTDNNRVVYNNQGATRNQRLAPDVERALHEATPEGYSAVVHSGGQPARGTPGARRTGSIRHDEGGAADFRLRDDKTGELLQVQDAKDLYAGVAARMSQRGFKGIGTYDKGYMHAGGGRPATWGSNTSSKTADPVIVQANVSGTNPYDPAVPAPKPVQVASADNNAVPVAQPQYAQSTQTPPGPTRLQPIRPDFKVLRPIQPSQEAPAPQLPEYPDTPPIDVYPPNTFPGTRIASISPVAVPAPADAIAIAQRASATPARPVPIAPAQSQPPVSRLPSLGSTPLGVGLATPPLKTASMLGEKTGLADTMFGGLLRGGKPGPYGDVPGTGRNVGGMSGDPGLSVPVTDRVARPGIPAPKPELSGGPGATNATARPATSAAPPPGARPTAQRVTSPVNSRDAAIALGATSAAPPPGTVAPQMAPTLPGGAPIRSPAGGSIPLTPQPGPGPIPQGPTAGPVAGAASGPMQMLPKMQGAGANALSQARDAVSPMMSKLGGMMPGGAGGKSAGGSGGAPVAAAAAPAPILAAGGPAAGSIGGK